MPHPMGQMYEHFLRRLEEAGAAGEYFTCRHIIDFMVELVDPQLGETIYDPAFGTCGFLTRALEWVRTVIRAVAGP
jgi:type I restriction enzyme M protein